MKLNNFKLTLKNKHNYLKMISNSNLEGYKKIQFDSQNTTLSLLSKNIKTL